MSNRLEVKIGINPISWSNDDLPSLGGETPLSTALSEGREIGYQGFELGNKFPKDPAALRDLMAGYQLDVVSGWYSGRLATRSVEEEIASVESHLDLLAKNGCKVMVSAQCRCTNVRASTTSRSSATASG
jgi:inosose dehydratase